MLDYLIRFSIERRGLVMACVMVMCGFGFWNFTKLPIDAVPDITNVQVMINTEAPGFTPLEVEQRVTFPIETAMAGLPNLQYTRSLSRYGLSQVTIIFADDTDIYFARQLVGERLSGARSNLPKGLEPELGPIATGLGEIFMFTVDSEPGAVNADGSEVTPTNLRSVHDWIIRPQLLRVPGVVEINPIGGYKREILVAIDPEKLLAVQITQNDVINAIANNNQNRGVGFVERNGAQWLLRVPGQSEQLSDLGNIFIRSVDGVPLRIRDVANIEEGKELRTGAATQNGREVVMSTVFMLVGENSRTVASAVAVKLKEIQRGLPTGITVNAVYDRTTLVDKTLRTVQTNLIEGALLVMVILFFLLGNARAAILTAAVIPIAMLITVTGMVETKTSANLMSLGALDFGLLVDGAIIIVENCLRRLSQASLSEQNQASLPQQKLDNHELNLDIRERLEIVFSATREVIKPALFGVFIITAVYFPIFALTGVEGKMFHPMAMTVVIALIAAMILSITFVPACIALMFRKPIVEEDSAIIRLSRSAYEPLLALALKARWQVVVIASLLVIGAGWQASNLGTEFVPNLDEGDIAMHALRIPGTSLGQAVELQKTLEEKIKQMPEVSLVFAKMGTADVATDAVPPSVADNFIIMKPRSEWPNPKKSKSDLIDELAELVEPVPGNRYEFLQPIQMRFNELLSGVRAELAIKVFGDDFETLESVGREIESVVERTEGSADIQTEKTSGLPIMTIQPKLQVLAQYGLPLKELQDQLAVALGGQVAGQFYQGDRRTDIVVRLAEARRIDMDRLVYLPIQLSNGEAVPLKEFAALELVEGFNQINRENGKRRVVVTANVRGRDLGSFVADVRSALNDTVEIPAGYWIEYGGTYQKLQSATERLMLVVPITLIMIIGLLFLALRSFKDSMIIFSGVPFALTGGILFLTLRGIPFSISAAVGFIALSGIAILNGLVMVSFIRSLIEGGLSVDKAIIDGALTRLRPVLTTALVASLGFVPMALNTGIGSEVQRPLATAVIGGVISSAQLTLIVLPVLYRLLHRDKDAEN